MKEIGRNRLSFRAIEVFVAAMEEGSIAKAAKRLGASSSAVSLQLSNLENVLDARLIERSARRFQLTAAGELFAPRAKSILDEVTSAKAEMASADHAPKMDIRMAVIEDFDHRVLPHWISWIEKQYPKCNFSIRSGASHENHAALSSRGFDIIVAADNTSDIDWVEEHPVLRDPYILVAANAEMAELEISQLMNFPFVRYSQEQLMGRQIEAQLRRTKTVPPQKYECSSNQAVYALLKAKNGWAITTASAYLGTISTLGNDQKMLHPAQLPIPGFSRTISLYSRRETIGEIPARFSRILRSSLAEKLMPEVKSHLPFIGEGVEILGTPDNQNL